MACPCSSAGCRPFSRATSSWPCGAAGRLLRSLPSTSLNLEEKVARPGRGTVNNTSLYAIKDRLAALIRALSLLRGPLTAASSGLRRLFGWETTYEAAGFCTQLQVIYTVDGATGTINVQVDTTDLLREGVTEVAMMNEQGGHHFDEYRDSLGDLLRGHEIGCWDEVDAEEASFVSTAHGLAFTLGQVPGARLFRGRELIGSRLAWSGFGYSFSPALGTFSYDLSIGRTP